MLFPAYELLYSLSNLKIYLFMSIFFCTFARKIVQERKHDMNIGELTSKAHGTKLPACLRGIEWEK